MSVKLLYSSLPGQISPQARLISNCCRSSLSLTIIPTGTTALAAPGPTQYPSGLNLELKTEPLPYSGETQGGHLGGEAGAGGHVMMGGYEGGYPQYHAGYEDRGGHGAGSLQWPGYHGHHHSQGSPTPSQRYPYYDSRTGYYGHSVTSGQAVAGEGGGGSWHEPVSVAGSRADSPGPGYPAPAATSANMYNSCKMQSPPSPQETKVREGRRAVI